VRPPGVSRPAWGGAKNISENYFYNGERPIQGERKKLVRGAFESTAESQLFRGLERSSKKKRHARLIKTKEKGAETATVKKYYPDRTWQDGGGERKKFMQDHRQTGKNLK